MRNLLPIIIFLLALTGKAQDKECLNFKVGKFKYTNPDYSDLITIRKDTLQIDYYPNFGWELTSKINWLNDCKYEMIYIAVNDSKLDLLIGTKFVIEIMEINNNKILCRTVSEGLTVEQEMIKIE
ncbi:hypothetical protein [Olleya aquimaris]|uniref:Uncharacterized protein n=1 Tax=Olleya aquimaris TaxID=639310 RepID=A0A327R8M7_9FLAO|nr:hypothetical protein [Olleya aquimaris]RAJ13256.1 hypothetical protein LY08_02156 [Olleya aquimaris]